MSFRPLYRQLQCDSLRSFTIKGATLSCVYAAIGPAPVSRGQGERGTDEPPAFLKIAFGFACLFVPLFKKSSHES
jgi:hypothetical protein